MRQYRAFLVLNNEYQEFKFETDGNAIEYLWTRFGMDTYIDKLEEIVDEPDTTEDDDNGGTE